MKEVTLDFQGFHWNRVALSLQNERITTEFEESGITGFVQLWKRHGLISRPDCWLLYMSIITYYAQEHDDPLLLPTIYFIVNKE